MPEALIRSILNGAAFVVFTVGSVVLFVRMFDRYMRHKRSGDGTSMPRALVRDLIFWACILILMAVPSFLGIFGVSISEYMIWVVIRTIVGLIAMATWLYYEFYVIGK